MTLPFRRRHNDHEASHDRAHAIIAMGFVQPTEPADVAWLESHLAGCPECTADAAAYAADRELLRTLRDQAPEPPRDLWARTASAIERERGWRDRAGRDRGGRDRGGRNGRGRPLGAPQGWRIGRVPVGVASGLLVVAVVLGVSFGPRGIPLIPSSPPGSDVAAATPQVQATPFAVDANALAWIQAGPDGSFEFRRASVDSVCPDSRAGCAPLSSGTATRLALTEAPQSVILSPTGIQIVVVTSASSIGGTDVLVVPVPAAPSSTETPVPATLDPTLPTAEPSSAATPVPPLDPTPVPPVDPGSTPPVDPVPSPEGSPDPAAGYSILSGVVVVGDAAYSPDGLWLAFSARPADGSTGPDLYLWRVGDPLATPVTSDHRTFFADWLGNLVLANVVVPAITPEASPTVDPTPSPTPVATLDPNATPGPTEPPVEEHPLAFTLDPVTGATSVIAGQDMWRPTVDPTGHSVLYWAGTLVADGTGTGWALGTGRLVLDGWIGETPVPAATESSAEPTIPTAEPTLPTATPTFPTAEPSLSPLGPAGNPVTIAEGPVTSFDAWYDPSGIRLAVWLADPSDPAVGTLQLIVLDPDTRLIDPATDPLPGVAALRGVSINSGRLAWVTPPGQDGEGSHLEVLGWNGREFGQVRTIQAEHLFVVR